jgi:stage II sporulation protein D
MSLAWSTAVRLLTVPAALFALVVAVASASASSAQEPAAPTSGEALFVISGRGWGHGVGMSQYGAYGQANAGRTYEQILAHYYTGTEIGSEGRKVVRVLLAEGVRALTIASSLPFWIRDGTGQTYAIPAGPIVVRPNLVLKTRDGKVHAAPPLVAIPRKAAAPLTVDGRQYRGKLEIVPQNGYLRLVNLLPLESYLEGVVANEMPHTWPIEALKAQAVAARSYALASLVKGKPFDLYSDVRSQVYEGVAGEQPRTSEAVRATAHQVLMYGGKVATTYYFSTSGGKTASAADVFGTPVPYLVSRPDPWDKDSPHHSWGPFLFGARTLQTKLAVDSRILDAVGVATPSGRLRSITLQTAEGSVKVPSALLRTSLGLRSTWVSIGVLRLDQPRETVVFGSTVRLTGIARALPSPALSSSPDGSRWAPVGALQRETSGVASLVVKPDRTLRYRIEVKGAASPAVLVRVAPRVELVQPAEPMTIAGTVRPRLRGAAVTIERRQGTGWVKVAGAKVDPTGAFRAQLAASQGSYRARVAETEGYAEGMSPVLSLTP